MLNKKIELELSKAKKILGKLGMPPIPEVFIGMKIHDHNGVLVFDDVQRGHSFTRNMYNLLYLVTAEGKGDGTTTFAAGNMTGKTTAGVVAGIATNCQARSNFVLVGAGWVDSGVSTGIRVGTGNTAFTFQDFALAAEVANGTSTGQMSYQAMASPVQSYASKIWTNVHSRVINNNSGANITIAETGIYWVGSLVSNSGLTFMLERDVLNSTVVVTNGAQLTVSYTFTMDFSAID